MMRAAGWLLYYYEIYFRQVSLARMRMSATFPLATPPPEREYRYRQAVDDAGIPFDGAISAKRRKKARHVDFYS